MAITKVPDLDFHMKALRHLAIQCKTLDFEGK